MNQYILSCSLVIYKQNPEVLKMAIDSFLNTNLAVKLILIDNSPTDELRNIKIDDRVEYIFNPSNPGFSGGHNLGISKIIDQSAYHLVLNPDIYFGSAVLENIIEFLEDNKNIGVLMPKVLYPDNSLQYVAKLLPTPVDFIVRRLIPNSTLKERIGNRLELRASCYNHIMDVPFLSGCFLLFRSEALIKVKGFDENIFMYTEDIDICRRVIKAGYRSVFYPNVSVYHDHEKKSFRSFKTFLVYLKSAIYYFNKWGWVWDSDRKKINQNTLSQIKLN
jgi:GT2 family glycosyltransferase